MSENKLNFKINEIRKYIKDCKKEGMKVCEIAKWLNEAGYTTRRGELFTRNTVSYYTPKSVKQKRRSAGGHSGYKAKKRKYTKRPEEQEVVKVTLSSDMKLLLHIMNFKGMTFQNAMTMISALS